VKTPDVLIEHIRADIARVRRRATTLTNRLEKLEARTRRLQALRGGDADAARRLDMLAAILEPRRIVAAIRAAVEHGEHIDGALPHIVARDILPADVCDVLVDAIPPAEFFEAGDHTTVTQVVVRSALMPLEAMITWTFVTDVVAPALGASAVATLTSRPAIGRVKIVSPRIIRGSGHVASLPDAHGGDRWTALLYLAGLHDAARHNTAIVLPGDRSASDYAAIPAIGGGGSSDSYQFGIELRAG
jgi:hypothetical protein